MIKKAFIIEAEDLDAATEQAIYDAVARVLAGASGVKAVRGWTPELARELDTRLRGRDRAERADVIRAMAQNGGQIDRNSVVEICGYNPERKINGFTKPVKGVIRQMTAEGLLPANAADPLRPQYPSGAIGQATGFTMPSEVAEVFIAAHSA